ncbi:MAG TPA: hypothetical protein VJA21_00340 [Verrucomicrobiae bacterium]
METSPLDVPLDLATWVAPQTIAHWIREEIDQLDRSKPEVRGVLSHPPDARPQVILSVLLFAYSTQRFTNSEILAACHSDPVMKQLCDGQAPFADEIGHFRRTHRALLEFLLGQLLIRAVREKFVEAGQLPPGLQRSLKNRAVDQIDTARHLSSLEGQ